MALVGDNQTPNTPPQYGRDTAMGSPSPHVVDGGFVTKRPRPPTPSFTPSSGSKQSTNISLPPCAKIECSECRMPMDGSIFCAKHINFCANLRCMKLSNVDTRYCDLHHPLMAETPLTPQREANLFAPSSLTQMEPISGGYSGPISRQLVFIDPGTTSSQSRKMNIVGKTSYAPNGISVASSEMETKSTLLQEIDGSNESVSAPVSDYMSHFSMVMQTSSFAQKRGSYSSVSSVSTRSDEDYLTAEEADDGDDGKHNNEKNDISNYDGLAADFSKVLESQHFPPITDTADEENVGSYQAYVVASGNDPCSPVYPYFQIFRFHVAYRLRLTLEAL